MKRRERRAAAREIAHRLGRKGTEKQESVRAISASLRGMPEDTAPARVLARGANGSRLEQRESGLVIAKSGLG